MSISSPTSVSVIRRSIPGLCGISVTTTSASRTLSCCGRSASIARAVSSVSSRITTWSPSTHDVTASRLMPLSASVFATMLNVPMAFGIRRTTSLPGRAVSMTGAPFLLSGQTRAIGEIMLPVGRSRHFFEAVPLEKIPHHAGQDASLARPLLDISNHGLDVLGGGGHVRPQDPAGGRVLVRGLYGSGAARRTKRNQPVRPPARARGRVAIEVRGELLGQLPAPCERRAEHTIRTHSRDVQL